MKIRCRLSSSPPVQPLRRLQFSLSIRQFLLHHLQFPSTAYNFPSPHRYLLSFPSLSSSCLRQFLHRPPSTRPELHLIFVSSLGFLLLSIVLASCSFGSSPLQDISSSNCFRVASAGRIHNSQILHIVNLNIFKKLDGSHGSPPCSPLILARFGADRDQ